MIQVYVHDIRESLKNKCYFAALSLALTLPDICGSVMYPASATVAERYIGWFDEYIGQYKKAEQFIDNKQNPWLSGEVIYNLRNTFLHQGNPNINIDRIKEENNQYDAFGLILGDGTKCPECIFWWNAENAHLKISLRYITIDVSYLCVLLCENAEKFYEEQKEKFSFGFNVITQEEYMKLLIDKNPNVMESIYKLVNAKLESQGCNSRIQSVDFAQYPEMTFRQFIVNDRKLYIYRRGKCGPVIFWPYKFCKNEYSAILEELTELLNKADIKAEILLVLVEIDDWNKELSPWEMISECDDKNFVGGGGEFYNNFLKFTISAIDMSFPTFNGGKYIVGYSLAGLFALWVFYTSQNFQGVAACSASLWFKDWDKFMQQVKAPADSLVYLSLGGKESQSKDAWMQTIDSCYNKQYSLAKQDKNIKKVVYQKNKGGHFANTDLRVINGIKWLLENSGCNNGQV